MGEFSDAFKKGAEQKAAAITEAEQKNKDQADARRQGFGDNERWVNEQLVPLLAQAKAELNGQLGLSWAPVEGENRGAAVVFNDVPNPSIARSDFAVHVDLGGHVSVFVGGGPKTDVGTIETAAPIAGVKRLLVQAISQRAKT